MWGHVSGRSVVKLLTTLRSLALFFPSPASMVLCSLSFPFCVVCLVAQSCLTLCDPMDCNPLGSSLHGDSPGRNAGVAMPSSRGSSQPRD